MSDEQNPYASPETSASPRQASRRSHIGEVSGRMLIGLGVLMGAYVVDLQRGAVSASANTLLRLKIAIGLAVMISIAGVLLAWKNRASKRR
jgi:hypothetical protein